MENRWEWKFTQMNSALDMAEGRISVLKETPVETIQSEAWIQKEKGDTHTHTHTHTHTRGKRALMTCESVKSTFPSLCKWRELE